MQSFGLTDFFFFKQKTAYEMLRSLVGSEMCIRDSCERRAPEAVEPGDEDDEAREGREHEQAVAPVPEAVSYTHLTLPTIYSV